MNIRGKTGAATARLLRTGSAFVVPQTARTPATRHSLRATPTPASLRLSAPREAVAIAGQITDNPSPDVPERLLRSRNPNAVCRSKFDASNLCG